MIRRAFIVVVLLLGLLFVVIATRPSEFKVTRSAILPAPPAEVFAQVNDLRKWEAWSPWARLDPNSTVTYDGPADGTGSSMSWAGNADVGEGKVTITESRPGELVVLRLDFIKPFAATSKTEFTFTPQPNDQTLVAWTMSGANNFISKAFSLVIDCDKMMGTQFEEGLANLKAVVSPQTKP